MVTDPELGKIEFVHNERSKYIKVRILPQSLKVTLPLNATEQDAIRFIDSVRKKLIQKQQKLETGLEKRQIRIDETTHLQTLTFDVKPIASPRKNIYFALKSGTLHIEYPHTLNCASPENQKFFWNGISHFMRKEAKRLLPMRTQQLADKFGFTFNTVKIQSSKSRWGSCSSEKNINLSLFLMLLPAHLVDYVILHELCHTKEMNHSDKFWRWMDQVTDSKSKSLRKELKQYHMPQ